MTNGNMLIHLPKLTPVDVVNISWWLTRGETVPLPMAIIGFTSYATVREKAKEYMRDFRLPYTASVTAKTAKKLFGEDFPND